MNGLKAYTHVAEEFNVETGKYALYAYDVDGNRTPVDDTDLVYLKSEADKFIEELEESYEKEVGQLLMEIVKLKAEKENLIKCCKEYESRQRIDERIKFNAADQLRATKLALWMARAMRNRDLRTLGNFRKYVESLVKTTPSIYHYPTKGLPNNQLYDRMMSSFETWCKYLKIAEDKCLKKAEEYK